MKPNSKIFHSITQHKTFYILLLLFCFSLFFHFYQLFERASIGWDQIDSAQAAKTILLDKHFVLKGVPAKNNTGVFMGPLYYYFVTPFFFFTRLDPVASPIIAGVTSIFAFFVLFFVTKKLFGTHVALMAVFINTFSLTIITMERTQNGIALIVPISYLLFYFLYKVITGSEKHIPYLALMLGIAFQIDFTSVFYPILILFALPFFPRTKKMLWYLLLSLPILLVFFFPIVSVAFRKNHATSNSVLVLFMTTFLGLHLRRVLQLTHDAFIQFIVIFQYPYMDYFDFLIPPLFTFFYYRLKPSRDRLLFGYLLMLWIVIPWLVLSTYNGELTDSYFSLPRDLFIAILAFVTVYFLKKRNFFIGTFIILFWGYYACTNFQLFMQPTPGNLLSTEADVRIAVKNHENIPWQEKAFRSYLYYIYVRHLGNSQ